MIKHYARFNSTDFVVVELPSMNDSSRETKFSNIEIDFRGYAETLLPIQYQEIQIIQIDDLSNETILMTCYCDTIEYPEFSSTSQPFILSISLLSPYTYASKRTISIAINNISLDIAIVSILQPLLDDGFTIETNSLSSTRMVNEIFKTETLEKTLNYLADKFNFVWYIDKDKKMYFKKVKDLLNQDASLVIDSNDCYLQNIQPVKTVIDYANKLNIKNAIIIDYEQSIIPTANTLTNGETYTFSYPITVSENSCFRLTTEIIYPLFIYIITGEEDIYYTISVDTVNKTITYDANIGFDGEDITKDIMLITDADDKTKIIGFKWNGADTIGSDIQQITTWTALKPYKITYIDPIEIVNIKSKVNTSGIIEKIVDANGKYFTPVELEEYALSLFSKNNIQTNEIKCSIKGKLDDADFITEISKLKISNIINVNLPQFYITGNYIITDIGYSADTQTATINLNARNYNLNESFLDIFRVALEQEQEYKIEDNLVVFYNQDNQTILSKEIYVNGVRVDV